MINVKFFKWDEIDDNDLLFAVIVSRFQGKWILAKHKDRETWEIPGGHREKGEDINITAARELQEETGAKEFRLIPICIYSVIKEDSDNIKHPTSTFGGLYFAEVVELGDLPNLEIEKIQLFDKLPSELTYPEIQPCLLDKVMKYIN
ncbi:NUDIX hydrolase [[Clostridium] sordellii]|uniref:NUDIX hydrolase n=1 Tax=Paraclostridium sordellii TaxID=1505 RepID=UPI0005E72383|nr:NUDIX domain-containing protein [Paeniclostridium sordellii]CEN23825.1 NUDIX hydrolase [[Clostridium] sordellii] [Paeniclostridium sordellii]